MSAFCVLWCEIRVLLLRICVFIMPDVYIILRFHWQNRGWHNVRRPGQYRIWERDPIEVRPAYATRGTVIYVVGFGAPRSAWVLERVDACETGLSAVLGPY
jgi:hypothetical protein